MSLPRRFLKRIARDLRFEDLDELNYVGAVALAASTMADPRVDMYVRYFKAEQEQDFETKERVYRRCEDYRHQEEYAQVTALLDGRRLLERPRLETSEVSAWLTRSGDGGGYAHFLAGIGGLQAGDSAFAARHLRISAVAYERAGKRSRELQSLLQDPSLSAADIRYLRAHARDEQDRKAFHVAGMSLATHARRVGDTDSAREYARESVRAFREEFMDPRRERLSQALLLATDPIDHDFTPLETRALKRLQRGPCSKSVLLTEVYGRASRYAEERARDTRFRALLSRLNRKMRGAIERRDGLYQLRRD